MTETAPNSNFSNQEETKKFVTSYAFGVHSSIIGMRLASPKRRLAAIFVDMLCIALLTTLSGFWFNLLVLIVAVWSLYRLKRDEGKRWVKLALKSVVVLASLTILIQGLVHYVLSDEQFGAIFGDQIVIEVETDPDTMPKLEYKNTSAANDYALEISSLKSDNGMPICDQATKCDVAFFNAFSRDLSSKGYSFDDAALLYTGVRDFLAENDRLDGAMQDSTLAASLYQQLGTRQSVAPAQPASNSIISWVSGFLADLGLSFGWAAMYFSVLTSSWNGQTVGKRLFGIKVVRLDGKTMDLWESFGRYGGYSAGVATGLLGFLQIYWDANRQGIQDKISETLVVQPKASTQT